ncbi:tryptophan transporter [Clostridium sp. Cult2]|uniref:tryptophan transporter n=1 Tax=Clostridium sp. Cult2 TaxID=2079003 RepID=UPI001F2E1192|nr:tryptophan transporter [Clostridium sp. Cult2]MCF6464616.1 tryptophan transporter [Clostridium sp. Cult2]
MRLKNNIFTTLLLAIGFILHQITPGILGGMKFDFLLSFMIVSLLLNSKFENAMLTGLLAGLLSAMTTTFPGGQLPNIIDKIFTCLILFVVIKYLSQFKDNSIIVGLIGGLGTFISGIIFLGSATFITGLPVPIEMLIITVVIPTTIVNGIGTVFVYGITKKAIKLSGIALH